MITKLDKWTDRGVIPLSVLSSFDVMKTENAPRPVKAIAKCLLLTCLLACAGCETVQPEANLRDQVSGTGELLLRVRFENRRSTDVRVFIDEHYIGEFVPDRNADFRTYTLPAGLRTIRVEATYDGRKDAYEQEVLILGNDVRQLIEARMNLD